MTDVIAVPISEKTNQLSTAFLSKQAAGDAGAAEALIERVDGMTEDMLNLFLVKPTQFISLSNGQQKIINFAVNTAEKASHMLTRQIFKKKTPAELSGIATLMKEQMWEAEDANNQQTRIAVPVSNGLVKEFEQARAAADAGEAKANVSLLTSAMDQLTEEILNNFFLRPTQEVKMGFVTQKALNVGVEGSRKAIQTVTGRVMGELNEEALAGFLEHFGQVMLKR